MPEQIHFVTGRLAETALREVVEQLSIDLGFAYTIQVMPISVAALLTPKWIAARLTVPEGADRVILPGYCGPDVQEVEAVCDCPVETGPRDLRQLPVHFKRTLDIAYGEHDIEIIAEINHAPRLSLQQIVRQAEELAEDGADVIDLGCDPGGQWSGVGAAVTELRRLGLRVSIDTFDSCEAAAAAQAGAELMLSVNQQNRTQAVDWGMEVVAIPDEPSKLETLDATVEFLDQAKVPFRLDPILEPIGCGFAPSLGRYLATRSRYPDAEIMMGIGNLTELTDADSAGVNAILLGFCQELGIRSVLTTQVINWARTSVKECDLARRLVHFAQRHRIPPKHLEPQLVLLRDPQLQRYRSDQLDQLAEQVRDHDLRIFADEEAMHVVGRQFHTQAVDPFLLFEQLCKLSSREISPSHAFYLGFELAKAKTAQMLGKQYEQDEPLDWGYLTEEEQFHRLDRKPL